MNLTLEAYRAAMQGLKATFQKAYVAAEPEDDWGRLQIEVPSKTREELHAWLLGGAGMGLWVGDKQVQSLMAAGFRVQNLPFEGTLGISRHDLEDDLLGGYDQAVAQMAEDAKRYPDRLTQLVLANGTATTLTLRGESVPIACWDGKALFASARTIGKDKSQTNIYNGTGVTYDKVIDDFEALRVGMGALKNGSGESLGRRPMTVVIPPTKALMTAWDIILGDDVPLGTPKIRKYVDKVLINYQASGNSWQAFDTSRRVKPVLVQMRERPHLVTPAPMDTDEFNRAEIKASVEGRFAVAPADWTCAALCQNN